ncbi:MAG: methyl-accepting chemotaxis protein [Lachnospiraceae bacterium]|nr:methyl-accepting chemotaxis protein [Lachnospiraceae bacterium]
MSNNLIPKVGTLHSVRTKLAALVALAILVVGVVMILIYSPNVKDEMTVMSQHYLHDLALSYGMVIDDEIDMLGKDAALDSEELAEHLDGVGMEGLDTSYIYIVSPEGTMLYHPTPEKIGEPVENEVVKGVTADIAKGKWEESKVVSYEFKGAIKYAAYYVNENADYILVVTVDEDEIFQPVANINKKGVAGVVSIFVLGSIMMVILVTILIVNPIMRISELTERASHMDFTENSMQFRLSARKDEIGLMARALGTLKEELAGVVYAIRESCQSLVESADVLNNGAAETTTTMEQVENAVNDIANGASNQAEETQGATENVILIGDMVKDTNATVEELMVSANEMSKANDNAKQILAELREINRQSGEYIDVIAKQTEVTNESALKIGEATKLITDIASETNLLSLNASIEAARAGEQGRGFAVVASEIQKLAEQSSESARTIEEIINILLLDSEKAVQTMRQVKEIIGQQTEHIVRTDEAFVEIQRGVSESIDGMQVIAVKAQEMDRARVNVVDVVNDLTAIAEENAAATEETSASVVEVTSIVADIADKANGLNAIAAELEEKIGIFQL